MSTIKETFRSVARKTSNTLGHPYAFIVALVVVIVWAACGPMFKYSDTWQLIINTGTTIATFLMIFLVQNTQNRDTLAIGLKLDELIKANSKARNTMINLESMTDEEIQTLEEQFKKLTKRVEKQISNT